MAMPTTFTLTTAALPAGRHNYLVTTFDADGNNVETVGSDYSSASSRNRAVKKMVSTMEAQGLTELDLDAPAAVEPTTSTVAPTNGTSVYLDADDAHKPMSSAPVRRLVLAVIDNPAKIAYPVIDGIDTVELVDLVTETEEDGRARKGVLGRLNRRRAALTAADQLAASYLEGSDTAATTSEETAAAGTPVEDSDVTTDAEKAYDAEVAAATSDAKTESAEPTVSKRDQAVLDYAEALYAMVNDGETVEVPFDGKTVKGYDLFPKGATQSWYWRTMPGVAAAKLAGVEVEFTAGEGLTVSRDLERTLADAKAHVAHVERLIAHLAPTLMEG